VTGISGRQWRLVLDGTRCDGHGICTLRCPELITLDGHGYAGVVPGEVPSRRALRRARRAVAGCPGRALALVQAEIVARDAQ
jgi:ferredoxin